VNENVTAFFAEKTELFPFTRPLELERFLIDNLEDPSILPVPSKLYFPDEAKPRGYAFPILRSAAIDELEVRMQKWLDEEVLSRSDSAIPKTRVDEAFRSYRGHVARMAQNALQSSILADYHTIFWLVHSNHVSRLFTRFPRHALSIAPHTNREQNDTLKYVLHAKWADAIREMIPHIVSVGALAPGLDDPRLRFLRLIADNVLIATEEFISADFGELRAYFAGSARRDFGAFKRWMDDSRKLLNEQYTTDRVFRRAVQLIGYSDIQSPLVLLDRRVQQLLAERTTQPAPDRAFVDTLMARLIEYFVVQQLRRGILLMETTAEGDNVATVNGVRTATYSKTMRPMDFGRRGIVEPIVYRFGMVYDITEFTQTLGEVARGGKVEEQQSYLQMLEFQRELAKIAHRHQLQFEKFLGDGAFYTSRRALRAINAAVEFQQFYSEMRTKGFAFNKGMRVALNYGYYRLLPMQVSNDGAEIKEFYGPGIVELSRLTTGKATKIIEEVQHLLVATGYDQMDVYRFFQPLARDVDTTEDVMQQREFFAYVNAHGNLINEGIVASIPFFKELSAEIAADGGKLYRLRAPWASYIGFPTSIGGAYVACRMLGAVSLKGIGSVEIGEIVRLTHAEAEVAIIEDARDLMAQMQQDRNRMTARIARDDEENASFGDLIVCQSTAQQAPPVILVGEWDPITDEVRRPIRLAGDDAERYGLAIPLTEESVGSQSIAYQKLYRKLSRMETLPSFSVSAIRDNTNFSGFIIGETVERI
jgi:hypothetical protein